MPNQSHSATAVSRCASIRKTGRGAAFSITQPAATDESKSSPNGARKRERAAGKLVSAVELPTQANTGLEWATRPPELLERLKTALPHGVLFPGQTMLLHCEILGDYVSGVMFVEGDVTYADVFRQRHKTGFCFYNFRQGGKDIEDMYPCSEGNTME